MQARYLLAMVLMSASLAGCQNSPSDPGPPPLSVQEWAALPAEAQKYSAGVLERVKEGDPKFQDEQAWNRFVKTVVTTARKKDFPGGLK